MIHWEEESRLTSSIFFFKLRLRRENCLMYKITDSFVYFKIYVKLSPGRYWGLPVSQLRLPIIYSTIVIVSLTHETSKLNFLATQNTPHYKRHTSNVKRVES